MFSGFGSFNNSFVNVPQKFEDFFRCYPVAAMNDRIRKDDANYGGKVFLPPSALNKLTMLNVRYPMLFELKSQETGKITHSGVLEFVAEEGRAYLPQWMMETLGVQPGSLLQIASTDVPLGQFVKIEPQSVDFLDISDPKAVLENVLRKFSTLSIDDIIEISYNNKSYRIKVLEVKPESASKSICVIETDLVTDFAPPVGYVEPDYKAEQQQKKKKGASEVAGRKFDPSTQTVGSMSRRIDYTGIATSAHGPPSAFVGSGQKLSGKPIQEKPSNSGDGNKGDGNSSRSLKDIKIVLDEKPAPLNLPDGQLFFGFPIVLPKDDNQEQDEQDDKPHFQGQGQSLRQSSKRKGKKDHASSRAKAPRSPEVIQID